MTTPSTPPWPDYIINAGSSTCDIPSQLGRIRSDFGTNLFLSLHIQLFATDASPVSVEGVHATMDFLVGGPGVFGTGTGHSHVAYQLGNQPYGPRTYRVVGAGPARGLPSPSNLGTAPTSVAPWAAGCRSGANDAAVE